MSCPINKYNRRLSLSAHQSPPPTQQSPCSTSPKHPSIPWSGVNTTPTLGMRRSRTRKSNDTPLSRTSPVKTATEQSSSRTAHPSPASTTSSSGRDSHGASLSYLISLQETTASQISTFTFSTSGIRPSRSLELYAPNPHLTMYGNIGYTDREPGRRRPNLQSLRVASRPRRPRVRWKSTPPPGL